MTDAREELEDAIRDVYDPWTDTPSEIADAILAKFPGIRDVIEGPVSPRKTIAERIVSRHLSLLSKRDDWHEDDTAIGGQGANIVRQLEEAGLLVTERRNGS